MFSTLASFVRLTRAALTLARHDAILPAEYQSLYPAPARWLGSVMRIFRRRDLAENPGERLARALEKLGPSYVKFGQILATRSDVVGERFARGLSRLQDRMPAFGDSEAREILADELGQPVDQVFSEFGPPVAAASIAQVHKAVTPDGAVVAVKILRPDIEDRIARDIRTLSLGAALAERLSPASRRLEPRKFVETVSRSLTLETDLRLEAAAASELAEAAMVAEGYHIPTVDWARSTRRVLTTQWIDGIALSDIDAIAASGIDRAALATRLTRAFLSTALDRGVFHADMHGGNLFARTDDTVWAVDFGIMGRIGRSERRFLALILHGFLTRDYMAAARAHFAAGYVPARHSVEDFASALRAVGEPIFGKTADQVPMSRVLMQLFEITALFEMRLRPELVMLQKTMVQCEGVSRQLDPQHDMWGAAAPIVEAWMKRELGPEGRIRDLGEDLTRLHDALRKLPDAVDDWAEVGAQLKAGKLSLGGGPRLRPWFLRLAWLSAAAAAGAAITLAFG
ncbi:2-octaprenylphenol hydroxylase [Maricaulis maris MCS10]|uniref:2-octaprenylphenol hydroxylase n=1 Tax=Maricaulis maris (strain MCS10) TaxID=394221 RepID=Q0AK42_MARMM|nr:2-polyprenylphenol 6-hydroxylase [Maricaulis maris]ABI67351.1 2-octaprenylphenol hydroxylase [Maricaulis maris MCS10]